MTTLDEQPESALLAELKRREDLRIRNLCDYCGRPPSFGPCKLPERHNAEELAPLGGEFVVDNHDLLGELGFCGCGQPEEAIALVKKLLTNMRDSFETKDHERAKALWSERSDLIGDGPLGWILLYHLDHLGLLEHGSSCFGSWLTKKGEAVLARLDKWAAAHPEEQAT